MGQGNFHVISYRHAHQREVWSVIVYSHGNDLGLGNLVR